MAAFLLDLLLACGVLVGVGLVLLFVLGLLVGFLRSTLNMIFEAPKPDPEPKRKNLFAHLVYSPRKYCRPCHISHGLPRSYND